MMSSGWFSASSPVTRKVRAYLAPVNRVTSAPALFDASQQGAFDLDNPPAPWISLGAVQGFARTACSKSAPIMTGIPAAIQDQARETLEARVSFECLSWTKLTMAIATGSQHMNLLAPVGGAALAADGAQAIPAVPIQPAQRQVFFSLLLVMLASSLWVQSSRSMRTIAARRASSVRQSRAHIFASP
jgi:hypothetical protein